MTSPAKRSAKHEEARQSLPEGLHPVFDDLVNDYQFVATRRHGSPWVSYMVLADLIREGWRRQDSPDEVEGSGGKDGS